METKTLNTANHSYLFVNRWTSHSYGFTHISNMLRDGMEISEGRSHWVNRTWERYSYQTSMRAAVHNLINQRTYHLERTFKDENGFKKLTAARRELFEAYCANDEVLKEYNDVLSQL